MAAFLDYLPRGSTGNPKRFTADLLVNLARRNQSLVEAGL